MAVPRAKVGTDEVARWQAVAAERGLTLGQLVELIEATVVPGDGPFNRHLRAFALAQELNEPTALLGTLNLP